MIFAREISDPLTGLVKKINAATASNSEQNLGSFVVFLSDDDKLAEKLVDLAKKEKIDDTILGVMEAAGPPEDHVNADADITVVLYTKRTVKANYAFKKGKMTDKDVRDI